MATLLNLLSSAFTKNVNPDWSFGWSGNIAPDNQNIPNWSISSLGHTPRIYSDRVLLTPPVPGNTRGALWGNNAINAHDWTAELEFRASGQAQQGEPSGNLHLWYVQNKESVGQNGVYTVGPFDGLSIIVDQYGGRGGSIRGFLNDGSQNFNAHTGLDSLAFGHCDFSYRNLGRSSKLRISNNKGLTVSIDDRPCFSSDKVTLPAGYFFGVTAATSDNPDSFEIFKFGVSGKAIESPPSNADNQAQGQQSESQLDNQQNQQQQQQPVAAFPDAPQALADRDADEIDSTTAQFADLHNRLQSLQHQLADMNQQFTRLHQKIDEKSSEVIRSQPNLPQDALTNLNRRMENTERIVQQIQRDVEGRDYNQHLSELKEAMNNVRGGLTEGLPESLNQIVAASAPRMGFFLFMVIGVQVLLAGAYILYKRRRANAPKKYL